ncbi:MAG: hypothetical protein GXY64_04010 [Bacteroidales bacterium]|nr:hypothetical protein [Bacteroidales bacterium]
MVILLFCYLGVTLSSFVGDDETPKDWYEQKDSLRADLARAILDAQELAPSKVSHTLMAINIDNPDQEWATIHGRKMVLVAAFMNDKGLPFYMAEDTFRIAKQTGVWVALPMDWQRRASEFEGLDSVASQIRMVQMLGLGVDCDYDHVVEFYADPDFLFRPAFNPDITTHSVEPSFPAYADSTYRVGETYFREWFAYNLSMAYVGDDALPWTQLGYTYDWHRGAPREGLTEFIVSFHTLVQVKRRVGSWTFIQEICQKAQPPSHSY